MALTRTRSLAPNSRNIETVAPLVAAWSVATTKLAGMLCIVLVPLVWSQSFTATGNLNTGRNGQRAVMLNSGKVLIVGGYDTNENAVASSELYAPATGTFAPAGSLNVARRNFGITLLDNGTVLVLGGYDNNFNVLASAEVYDPATGLFTLTGSLNVARGASSATLLPDGTVLVAGGFGTGGGSLNSAELYMPAAGSFVATGNLNRDRGFATATAMADGTVLIEGGWSETSSGGGTALSSAEIYNPATGSFSTVGSLNVARVRNTATLLDNGSVLVAGGNDASGNISASAEIYSPATGRFTPTGSLNTARGDHAATLLTNGTVLVVGGFACQPSNCAGTAVNSSTSAEIYDPVAAAFTPTGNLSNARQANTATLLTSGSVLVAGGWSDSSAALTSAELYQPTSLTLASLVSIAVTPANPSLFAGASQALIATGTFSDNSTQTLDSVIWSSSDSTIASITNDSGSNSGIGNDSTNSGVVSGISPGTMTATACDGNICGSTAVTVLASGSASSFALLASPASYAVKAGETATFSLLLAPSAGFTGMVILSCSGVPTGAHCTISPSSLRISEPVNAALTVSLETATSSISSALITKPHDSFWANSFGGFAGVMFLPLILGMCFLLPKTCRRASATLVLLVISIELIGCGGTMQPQSPASVTPGSYEITVIGTSAMMSRSTQLHLIVE